MNVRDFKVNVQIEHYVWAHTIWLARSGSSAKSGDNHAKIYDGDMCERRRREIGGALAELYVAQLLGGSGAGAVCTYHKVPDVLDHLGGIEVRHTRWPNGKLLLREEEPDARYILVTGWLPTLTIRGYIWRPDGLRPEWLRDCNGLRKPCYWVPQRALKSIPLR